MNPVLAIICIWALIFSVSYLSTTIKYLIYWDFKKFQNAFVMFLPFSIVWLDTFLRLFSPNHTGLW